MKQFIFNSIILNILLFASASVAMAVQVTNTADSGAGSLRDAVTQANTAAADDTITFNIAASDPNCSNKICTITLTSGEIAVNAASTAGKLVIDASAGINKITLSGNSTNRVFYLKSGSNLTLNAVTLTKGFGIGSTNPDRDNYGGAIYNFSGVLTITNSAATANFALYNGGVIFNDTGTVNIGDSTFDSNTAHYNAGVLLNDFSGTANITNSTFSNNLVELYNGGAIENDGTMTLTGSTINGNVTESAGGGILNDFNATLTVNDSTISGNSAKTDGGGIFNSHNATLTNVTIAENTASYYGGGIYNNGNAGTPKTNLRNSIVATNVGTRGQPDIYHVTSANDMFTSNGNNLIGSTSTNGTVVFLPTDVTAANPHLTPLGFYGGATRTQALAADSAAVNKGSDCVLTANGCLDNNAAIVKDQRGAARTGTTDIGAFELNNTPNLGTYAANLPNGTITQSYNFVVVPANSSNCTYQISSGSLPNGLTLTNANGGYSITGTPTLGGNFRYTIAAICGTPAYTNLTNYVLQVSSTQPTATNAAISGRVITDKGRGLINAVVILTDSNGRIRMAKTGINGRFQFTNVAVGSVCIIQIQSKRYVFEAQALNLTSDAAGLVFQAVR